MAITVDASAAAAWFLPDEASNAADLLFVRATDQADLFQAPSLWAWETGNLLHMACRRGRLPERALGDAVALLHAARIQLEAAPDEGRTGQILALARQHQLTFYDASYLEQALRTGAQLASRDAALRRAADAAGVVCIDL